MTQEQYEALAALKLETELALKKIYSDTKVLINFSAHHIDPKDEIWLTQNPQINKRGTETYFSNHSFSRIDLFSNDL